LKDWRTTNLGDCAEWLSGGTPFKGNPAFWSGTIPWVSAKDMKSFRLYDAQDHISQDAGGKVVAPGTVLILVRGMTLHNDVPICVTMRKMAFNQDVKAIRAKPDLDHRFLAYWLIAHKPELLSSVDHAGHGTGRLLTDLLKKMRIDLPTLAEQRAIAGVLAALDDKIELNRRMNETLEALAQTLFNKRFVDAAATKLPKGWRKGEVSEIAAISREGVNPGEFPEEAFDHYSIPAFDEGRSPKPETGDTIKSNKFIVPAGCVMVSKLNPRIPRIWMPDLSRENRAVCSTEFLVTIPKNGASREFLYCVFKEESFISTFATMVTGTSGSHQRVKPESLLAMDIIIPPAAVMDKFTDTVAPMLQRINHNIAESRTLAELRDALLPKLLSGELRVPTT
jgi:type I restriction enzyme, S subunit